MDREPITTAGLQKLKKELSFLKEKKRPEIVNAIAEARSHGDLKENAEYHAAREQQGFCEGRIQEIEGKLAESVVIDITSIPVSDKVIFGATVTIINIETDEAFSYKIVGEDEADVKQAKISVTSPIARALVGKEVGETVVVLSLIHI